MPIVGPHPKLTESESSVEGPGNLYFIEVLSEKLWLTEIEKDSIPFNVPKEVCQKLKYSEFTHPKYFLMYLLVLPHFSVT